MERECRSGDRTTTEGEYRSRLALMFLDCITAESVWTLEEYGVSAEELLDPERGPLPHPLDVFDRHISRADRIGALEKADQEIRFMERHDVRFLSLLSSEYPPLLREIPDAPVGLFVLGEDDLSVIRNLAIVGTRKCTQYGLQFCNQFVEGLSEQIPDTRIVSGLAYGIDTGGHDAALSCGLKTWAVVAHGLDTIYPAANRDLAARIVRSGGLIITEYPSGTRIFRNNFLHRNRIVAGLCPATLVVESEIKGGAMSTANTAFSYSREVFALPGRYTDLCSEGCNHLIASEKASIYTGVKALIDRLGWVSATKKQKIRLPEHTLFPQLAGAEKVLYDIMQKQNTEEFTVDKLAAISSLKAYEIMAALTELEFAGLVSRLPGSRYRLC